MIYIAFITLSNLGGSKPFDTRPFLFKSKTVSTILKDVKALELCSSGRSSHVISSSF